MKSSIHPLRLFWLCSLAFLLSASSVFSATYYVAFWGSDSNAGTESSPWKTINKAVGSNSPVQPGDVVIVKNGSYYELVKIQKSGTSGSPITLRAESKSVRLYDPDPNNGGFREGVIQVIDQEYLVIEGFHIEKTSWAGISVMDSRHVTIQNNRTVETGSSGIIVLPYDYFGGGEEEVVNADIKVLNNTIEKANWRYTGTGSSGGDQEALTLWGVNGFEIAYNILKSGKREGLDVKTGTRNGSIHHNTVSDMAIVSGDVSQSYGGGPGIYLDGNRSAMFNISVYNNLVFDCQASGITVADEVLEGDVHDIRIYNNIVRNVGIPGSNYSIEIGSNVRGVVIAHNTFSKARQMLLIDGSDNLYNDDGLKAETEDIVVKNNIFEEAGNSQITIEDTKNVRVFNNLLTTKDGSKDIILYRLTDNEDFTNIDNVEVPDAGLDSDYRPTSSSPAINQGADNWRSYLSKDRDGNTRPYNGSKPDIGAYEFGGTPGSTPPPSGEPTVSWANPTNGALISNGGNIPLEVSTSGDVTMVTIWYVVNGQWNWLTNDSNAPFGHTFANAPAGTYQLVARGKTSDGASTADAAITITVGGSARTASQSLTKTHSLSSPIADTDSKPFLVYPNPSTDGQVHLNFDGEAELMVVGLAGNTVLQKRVKNVSNEALTLPRGFYNVIVRTDAKILQQKLLIK